jgi:N-glycosylase/DNA lyase
MPNSYSLSNELLTHYRKHYLMIRQRLEDFSTVMPEDYFYELCYTLCTPQSKAKNAIQVVEILKSKNFQHEVFNPSDILRQPEHYIRFHNQKSISLMQAQQQYDKIQEEILSPSTPQQKREWLVKNVRGMGMKEASHFLRNIGIFGVAILDRHILKNLALCGVIEIPSSLTTTLYKDIELRWKMFAESVEISLDEMDLLFWSMETGEVLK